MNGAIIVVLQGRLIMNRKKKTEENPYHLLFRPWKTVSEKGERISLKVPTLGSWDGTPADRHQVSDNYNRISLNQFRSPQLFYSYLPLNAKQTSYPAKRLTLSVDHVKGNRWSNVIFSPSYLSLLSHNVNEGA